MKNIIKGILCAALVGVMAIAAVGCSASVTLPDWLAQQTCKHETWDEGEVTKEATCTEKGLMTYTCDDCGKTKTEEIELAAHDEVLLFESVSTCETVGEKVYECKDCGALRKEKQEKAEHMYGDDQTCDICEYTYYVAKVVCGEDTVLEIKFDESTTEAALIELKGVICKEPGYEYKFSSELPEELELENITFNVEKVAIETEEGES